MYMIPRIAAGFLAAGLALTPALPGQEPDVEALKAKLEHKLESPFIEFGGWITDFDVAKEKAKAEGKLIFVYFSRSYSP